MRKRIWLTVGILLILCCGLLLQHLALDAQKTGSRDYGTVAETNRPNQSGEPKVAAVPENPSAAIPSEATAMVPLPPKAGRSEPAADQKVLTVWQAPIEFYGKVVDENSNPVSGATISFQWVEVPKEEGNRTTNVDSDSSGLFSLHDARGPSLSVSVRKDGYYSSREEGHPAFKYGVYANPDFSPDPLTPVVFHLHRARPGVELVTSANGIRPDVAVRVPKDNTPVRVDLFQKQASGTGQLEISQSKPPWKEATNWSFRISIPAGGLVENEDEFQFEAPETNFLPTVECHFAKGDTNWVTHVTKQFYITFGEPRKYGWLRIESDLAQETLFLTYAINPSGSRNLEPPN